MDGTIVHQLTRCINEADLHAGPFGPYFVDHAAGVYPTAASGWPYSAASMAVKGDPMADLCEDLAADAAIISGQRKKARLNSVELSRAFLQSVCQRRIDILPWL